MKRLSVLWYTAMAVLFFAGRITGRRELFLLLLMMGFVALYALALNLWTFFAFSYVQEADNPIAIKGEETRLSVKIYNDKPFPFPLMKISVIPVAYSQRALLSFTLLPRSHISFSVPLACLYRGVYEIGMTRIEINDCFGLVKTTFNMLKLPYYRQNELKIFPRLTELPALPAHRRDARELGGPVSYGAESGEAYTALRPYLPGDPLKRIHRTASARSRKLLVKVYDVPLESSVLILLDTATGASGESALYLGDLACECAADIAYYCLKTGNHILFCGDARSVLVCDSPRDFERLYEHLATMRFETHCDTPGMVRRAMRQHPGPHMIYVITARRDEETAAVLKSLSANGHAVKMLMLNAGRFDGTLNISSPANLNAHIPGVQCVSLSVGDNVPDILSRAVETI